MRDQVFQLSPVLLRTLTSSFIWRALFINVVDFFMERLCRAAAALSQSYASICNNYCHELSNINGHDSTVNILNTSHLHFVHSLF